uniref:procollagen-proline 4-dioxygenase n=1 Tax=Cyclopterus lumpus TaxID=8103 RepID=A0A8C2X264_CYCLU
MDPTCVYLSWSLLAVAVIPGSLGEMYTSLLNVKQAISVEQKLIDYLRIYIDHESERLEDIKRFYDKVSDLHTELYKGPAAAMANPLAAFTLIKRLNEALENSQGWLTAEEDDLPTLEDLQGAAKGLMRLQDVYALQVASLVRVCRDYLLYFMTHFCIPCDFTQVAYEQEDYYHSVQWLEESVRLFRGTGGEWSPENEGTLEDALDHLAFSHFKVGGRTLGKCTFQPMQFKNPKLFCDYFTNGNPQLLLLPVRREVLSLQPYVVVYHNFITDTEAEDIKRTSHPGVSAFSSSSNTPKNISGEKQATAEYRISKSAWLKGSAHSTVGKLDHKISMLTGLNVKHPYGEYLQVVNYGIGGHYEPHFDHATSPSSPVFKLKTGNRVATFMIYLSSVEAGGSTAFIYANFSVPKAAIFWWNLHRNGQGDADTLHAGCPVLIGDKWVANKWIHEHGQEFQHRCSLNPEE